MTRFLDMSEPNRFRTDGHRSEGLDDQAMDWVVLLTSGESTADDHDAFRIWREESPDHREAIIRARTLWTQIGQVAHRVESKPPRRFFPLAGQQLAMAASLVLCVLLSVQYLASGRYDYVTANGEQLSVRLPDNSEMVVGGGSAVRVDFDGSKREIHLDRGLAFFHTTHDESRPFDVHADGYTVRDIGTAFSVRHETNGMRVIVTDGLVEAVDGDERVRLQKNEGLTMSDEKFGPVESIDADVETAWTQGRLVIENRSLEYILDSLGPHYDKSIVLINDTAAQRNLSVVIDLNRIDDWIAGLEKTEAVKVSRIGSYVILR